MILNKYSITFMFIILFFSGTLELLLMDSRVIEFLIDITIVFVFLNMLNSSFKFRFPFQKLIIILITIVIISFMLNSNEIVSSLKFFRRLFIPYFLLFLLYNGALSLSSIYKVNRIIIILCLVQIPAAIIKYTSIGKAEQYIGTMSILGGGLTTIFGLLSVAYLFSLMLTSGFKYKYLLFLGGTVFFVYVGMKRAFYFFLPILIVSEYFIFRLSIKKYALSTIMKALILVTLSILISVYSAGRIVPDFNPDHREGGRFNLNFMLNYIDNYNKATTRSDAFGRQASTAMVLANYKGASFLKNVFGYGPGELQGFSRGDGKLERHSIGGIVTGFGFYVISIGFLGVSVIVIYYLFFFHRIYRFNPALGYWKQFRIFTLSSIIIILLDFFLYSPTAVVTYNVSLLISYSLGIILFYEKQITLYPQR